MITSLLTVGCSTAPSSGGKTEKVDRLVVPHVKEYTKAQQKKAFDERQLYCEKQTPMLCEMNNDYGRMRDEARVALGLKVDVKR